MPAPIPILYQDDSLIVFNKPAGILVVPDHTGGGRTLTDIVNEQYPPHEGGRLYPCHRLDRDTSGAIIYARGKANEEKIMNEFRSGKVDKKYVAIVHGRMRHPAGEIKSLIQDYHEKKFRHDRSSYSRSGRRPPARPAGKLAITRYKVIFVKHLFSLVEVVTLTGRTNQIRIHFSELKHPLLGERLYALGRDALIKFRRVALHARDLTFRHPVTRKLITVHCELAKDMENFLKRY